MIHLVGIDVSFASQGEGDLGSLGHDSGDVLFLAGKHPHFHLFAGHRVEVGDGDIGFVSPCVFRCVVQIDPSVSSGGGACGAFISTSGKKDRPAQNHRSDEEDAKNSRHRILLSLLTITHKDAAG